MCRISLLRSPTTPDPHTDEGVHDFSFAIMPHVGHLTESNVYKKALAYTNPLYGRLRLADRS